MARPISPKKRPQKQTIHSVKDLGLHINAKRTQLGLRIDDAAALCGVSVDTLSKLENGKVNVGFETALKVLFGLGMTLKIDV